LKVKRRKDSIKIYKSIWKNKYNKINNLECLDSPKEYLPKSYKCPKHKPK
jgi:hypothetical protein